MTSFLLISALVTLAGLIPFLLPAGKSKSPSEENHNKTNLFLLEERQSELASESLDADSMAILIEDTERQMLEELDSGPPNSKLHAQGQTLRWVFIGLIPLLASGVYLYTGHPELLDDPPIETARKNRELIGQLAERLKSQPDDLEGWVLLGRSLLTTQRAGEASVAFEAATRLAPGNPDLLALYAEALAEAQGGRLEGKPAEIIRQIVDKNPRHKMGLWLAGLAAAQEGDPLNARENWGRLKKELTENSPEMKEIDSYLSQLEPETSSPGSSKEQVAIRVRVSIESGLLKETSPDDVVFIFARLPEGPPMPLAVVRKTVRDLPADITLDDSLSMRPGFVISAQDRVILGARVSKSGDPIAKTGDLEGYSEEVQPGDKTMQEITISQRHR